MIEFDKNYDQMISADEFRLAAKAWKEKQYSTLRVQELKDALRDKDLPLTGNKSELVLRLIEHEFGGE